MLVVDPEGISQLSMITPTYRKGFKSVLNQRIQYILAILETIIFAHSPHSSAMGAERGHIQLVYGRKFGDWHCLGKYLKIYACYVSAQCSLNTLCQGLMEQALRTQSMSPTLCELLLLKMQPVHSTKTLRPNQLQGRQAPKMASHQYSENCQGPPFPTQCRQPSISRQILEAVILNQDYLKK